MSQTSAGLLVERLLDWGVDTIFGLPGDGINGLLEALRQVRDRIRFVHMRHEEAAAFAAVGYAKFSGRLGVCMSTSGPGAIHLLNGLYDAKLDGVPVLAITGMTYHDLIGTHYQQDVNTDYLFQDVALFNQRIMGPAHVEHLTDLAIRTALSGRGVAHLAFPTDLQELDAEAGDRSKKNVAGHTAAGDATQRFETPVRVPLRSDLERAARVFEGKKRIVILAGAGSRGAADTLEAVAKRLSAIIAKPLLGKDVLPDDSPWTTGGVGLLGTRASQDALEHCDALLIVGSSFPYIEYYPKADQAVGVQIDDDPARIGIRFPVDVGLVGDAPATLRELLPLLPRNEDTTFLEEGRAAAADWLALMELRGTRPEMPMKPRSWPGNWASSSRKTRSSHPTPARSPPGQPVRSVSGPASGSRSAATWPRWPTVSRTRSARRSPSPADSAWPLSATADFRCSWPSSRPAYRSAFPSRSWSSRTTRWA